MRIWEFEDNKDKVIPSDLVREQDFILRIRRLHRLAGSYFILNIILSNIDALTKSQRAWEAVQHKLQEFSKITTGTYAEMSNGDAFIIWEGTDDAHLLFSRTLAVLSPYESATKDTNDLLISYNLPQDYQALRERANRYIEVVRDISSGAVKAPDGAASDAPQGTLTAWGVDQISKSLQNIDMQPYCRAQSICRYDSAHKKWVPLAEEFYISFDEFRRDHFPKLDLIMPEHLFLVLCETLDNCLLKMVAQNADLIDGKTLHLNMAVNSTLSPAFAHFALALNPTQRSRITFELHRGDLLQNFGRTLDAIKVLKREGFGVALDSITLDMANYIDLDAFKTDYIKIKVPKDQRPTLLQDPVLRKALEHIPVEKLIFAHCDSEQFLAYGRDLGVDKFQGWLIDKTLETTR